jgi:hypothetical protein
MQFAVISCDFLFGVRNWPQNCVQKVIENIPKDIIKLLIFIPFIIIIKEIWRKFI